MPNTFFGMTIGASGLTASNAAINTVAHNVSNINTKGYTRQSTEQKASFGIRVNMNYGAVGTGVMVTDIVQARSEYYDNRFRQNNAKMGLYETTENYSGIIENYLDEFNLDGFITEYNNLFKTIDQMASDPASVVNRGQFISYMSSICEYFNTLSTNLSNTQNDINTEIKSTVSKINTIAEQIASLNKQINTIEANGGSANDLMDSRNLLVDELSYYADVDTTVREKGNGITEFNVMINGQSLVHDYTYSQLVCVERTAGKERNASDVNGLYDIYWDNGMPYNPYEETEGGSLKALFDLRDGNNDAYEVLVTDATGTHLETQAEAYRNPSYKGIPYYQSMLNTFITEFANQFNSIMKDSYLADGTKCDYDLLVSQYGTNYLTAANVTVNKDIVNDWAKLPSSMDTTRGQENNDMAKAMYALKDKVTIKSGTFWDFLSSIVSEVSVDTLRAKSFTKNYSDIKSAVDQQRESISGVDEDEEGIDLVKFQNAYNLASKVISVMNEVYSKLIEETGL